jgi:hypothetical protein
VLRWQDPFTGDQRVKTTDFTVLTKAKLEATEKSSELQRLREQGPTDGSATWPEVLTHYEQHYAPTFSGSRQAEVDARSLDVWRAVLPPFQPVHACESHLFLDFIKRRQRGDLVVPGRKLKRCGARAPAMDLEWLRRVVNIAIKDGKKITKNPVLSVDIPKTRRPRQPDAAWERFEALRPHCERNGVQDLFGGFMDLVAGLGWRVSALARLHVTDVDRRPRATAPNGRLLKREAYDKEGYEAYVPISDWLAPRLDELLARRKRLRVVSPWLFPKAEAATDHWRRDYLRERLEVAEKWAGLEPIEGGDFHPYRRMWANLRKHLPLKDVAYAGCWNERTLLAHYQKSDDHTVLSVMNAGLPIG